MLHNRDKVENLHLVFGVEVYDKRHELLDVVAPGEVNVKHAQNVLFTLELLVVKDNLSVNQNPINESGVEDAE